MPQILWMVVLVLFTSTGPTKDSGIRIFKDEKSCKKSSAAFAKAHKVPYKQIEPCLWMKADEYSLIAANETTFVDGPDWPIRGGYKCKKNRKGKLYSCVTFKDTLQ